MSATQNVLKALENGEELTTKQISARYGVVNPRVVINALRNDGHAIYLNEKVNSKGKTMRKYRLGTPSKAMVAAAASAGFFSS